MGWRTETGEVMGLGFNGCDGDDPMADQDETLDAERAQQMSFHAEISRVAFRRVPSGVI